MRKEKFSLLVLALCGYFTVLAQSAFVSIERSLEVADSLYAVGYTDSALSVCREMVPYVEKEKNVSVKVAFYTSQGVYLRSSGLLDEAVVSYDKALEYINELNLSEEEGRECAVLLYNNLAALHLDMQSKEKAEAYASRAASMADECTDKGFRAQIYGVTSSVFMVCKQYEKACTYLSKAIDLAHEAKQYDAELNALTYYILALDRMGSSEDEVRKYARRAESVLPHVQSVMSRINYYQILFVMQSGHKQFKDAIKTANRMLQMDELKSYPFVLYDIYNNLHLAYSELRDYEHAYMILNKAKVLNDSLFQVQKSQQLEELSVKYESKEKELEILKLNEEKQKVRQRLYILTGSLVSLLVILVLLIAWILQRQKYRKEQQKRADEARKHEFEQLLYDTKQKLTREYLEKLEHEHAELARELHDGICNDLFSIEVSMQSNTDFSADALVGKLREAREGIRKVSHQMLPPVFQEATIDEVIANYLSGLVTDKCSISFQTLPEEVDWTGLPDEMMLNVYRIVQEAVGNALKHADATKIQVVLEWKLPDLEIRICDNGIYGPINRMGVGIQTMRERATALKGTFTLEKNDQGTKVTVRIPVF